MLARIEWIQQWGALAAAATALVLLGLLVAVLARISERLDALVSDVLPMIHSVAADIRYGSTRSVRSSVEQIERASSHAANEAQEAKDIVAELLKVVIEHDRWERSRMADRRRDDLAPPPA